MTKDVIYIMMCDYGVFDEHGRTPVLASFDRAGLDDIAERKTKEIQELVKAYEQSLITASELQKEVSTRTNGYLTADKIEMFNCFDVESCDFTTFLPLDILKI